MASADLKDALQAALGSTYTLERELGRGGMATVFLAIDVKHKRRVALKVLHPDLATALGPERFRREIELAAQLQHPHILSVHDSGETPTGLLWFTMPYVEGESLRDRLNRDRQLPIPEALRIASEAAEALDYAHRHGVVHRDIKPENILLAERHALVADFGIARALAPPSGSTQTLTETGISLGTPAYMSPEQASGQRDLDGRTDIYSLGAVLYEMLAGEPPFTGPNAQAVIARRFSEHPRRLRSVRDTVPEGVDRAVDTALATVPADRFATAGDLAKALELADRASSAPAPAHAAVPAAVSATAPSVKASITGSAAPPSPRARKPFPAVFTALGLGFLVGVGVLFAWRSRSVSAGGAAGATRLAVLPFDNLGDSADAYFADGLTDAVRNKLAGLNGIEVIASTSSGQYRHSGKTAQQIGQELGARYLLVGKVRWAKLSAGQSQVQVSPELIDATSAAEKWGAPFDAPLTDVFQVQSDIAGKVAQELKVALTPASQQTLAQRPTQNLAAYDAYLRSTAFQGNDPATLRRSLAYAEQAVALDSTFAAAWAEVALRHALLYANTTSTPADAAAARHAADRAVALAPRAPEGYEARGYYALNVARDVQGAVTALGTAVRLAPSSASAVRRLSAAEGSAGRWNEALAHAQQAVTLDPRSSGAAHQLTSVLLTLRRYGDARAAAARALALGPGDLLLIEDAVLSRLGEGDLSGAHALLDAVPPTLDRGALVAYVSNYYDLYWVLSDADRALALTLPTSAFDDDRGSWGIVRAEVYWLEGNTARARVYADSARLAFAGQVRATPNDAQRHLFLGLALAYLGQREAALQEEQRALTLARATGDQFDMPYFEHVAARLDLALGEHEWALDHLESLLREQYWVSPGLAQDRSQLRPAPRHPAFRAARQR